MKKKAKDLKVGDKVVIAGKKGTILGMELSDIGKQGTKKCRFEISLEDGEKVVVIRPEDYPFDIA